MNKTFLVILLYLFFQCNSVAAQQHMVGLGTTVSDIAPFSGRYLIVQLGYEYQFSQKSGIETGLYFRNDKHRVAVIHDGAAYNLAARMHELSVPILYKFYSPVINIAAGGVFNALLGWKQLGDDAQARFEDISKKPSVGYLVKMSHRFRLNEVFFVEPEIFGGSYDSFTGFELGAGVSVKYNLANK